MKKIAKILINNFFGTKESNHMSFLKKTRWFISYNKLRKENIVEITKRWSIILGLFTFCSLGVMGQTEVVFSSNRSDMSKVFGHKNKQKRKKKSRHFKPSILQLAISTQPSLLKKKIPNASLFLKSSSLQPSIALHMEWYKYIGNRQLQEFSINLHQQSFGLELRFYPFPKGGKIFPSLNINSPCFKHRPPPTILNGLYLASGFTLKKSLLTFKPNSISPISSFPYHLKNNAFTLNLGYHFRFYFLNVDLAYGGSFGNSTIKGLYAESLPINLNNVDFPVPLKISGTFRLQVGFFF